MDTRAHQNPLPGLRERLLATVAKTKSAKLTKLEVELEPLSQRVRDVAAEYGGACVSATYSQDNKLSPEGKLLEKELKKLQTERDGLRLKIREARAVWLPELHAAARPLLAEANEVLHEVVELLDAVQAVHDVYERYIGQNGFVGKIQTHARLLESYADNIRRFLERSK